MSKGSSKSVTFEDQDENDFEENKLLSDSKSSVSVPNLKMLVRWGIISTGKISNDFVNAVKQLNEHEHVIAAVAATDVAKAKDFAKKYHIATVCKTYAEMATAPVDVVYIGAINTVHYEIAKLMLQNKKPVLCEKPLCMKLKETQELVALAQKNNVFLMEAIWSRCFPAYATVRSTLENKKLGEIYHLQANFGVPIADVPRLRQKELGGGTILDLGVYVIQLAVLVFGENPKKIISAGQLNPEGVDECANIILEYEGGKFATLTTHSKITSEEPAKIFGSSGKLVIKHPFWCPTELIIGTTQIAHGLPSSDQTGFNFLNSSGLAYEAQEVRKCLMDGKIESSLITHSESIAIAKIQKAVMEQIGVKYD